MRRAARLRVILNLFIDVTNRIDTMLRIPDYRFGVPRQRLHAGRDVTRASRYREKAARNDARRFFFPQCARDSIPLGKKKTEKEKKETTGKKGKRKKEKRTKKPTTGIVIPGDYP